MNHLEEKTNLNEKPIVLQQVMPTNSLFFKPMACEEQAARIRNKTVYAIQNNDSGEVVYRYMQNKRGMENTFNEAIWYGLGSMLTLSLIFHKTRTDDDYIPTIDLIGVVVPFLHVLPNIQNTKRYAETTKACKTWLINKFDKESEEYIGSLGYNAEGLMNVRDFLATKGISFYKINRRKMDFPFTNSFTQALTKYFS